MASLYKRVIKGEYRPIPKQYSNELRQIIDAMLMVKSKERISIKQLVAHPSLQAVSAQFGF